MSGYPQVLKYFMWPWQVHYRISCQSSAESLFNSLDRGLNPQVSLIGILLNIEEKKHQVCIDPENFDFPVTSIEAIDKIATEIYNGSEDKNMFYSGEGMQEEMNKRLKRKSFRLAIEKILNNSRKDQDIICFASSPVIIDDYAVYVILELNRSVYESHILLKKDYSEERIKIIHSLVEASKDAYLHDRFINLHLPDPGKNLSTDAKHHDELLRDAARKFMYTISWPGRDPHGLHVLFDACNKISMVRYEGSENNGQMIIARKNHPDIQMTFQIEEPFSVDNFRKVRKLLQMSNEEVGVICNSYDVLGLGKINPSYNQIDESIFNINFRGTFCWDVVHCKNILFQMRYGLPQIPQEIINKILFFSDANRIFKNIADADLENIYTLSLAATKQEKGAMLIVSSDASKEAERLSKQCIKIVPLSLNPDLVLKLSSIDGGILIDTKGIAYAHGVILDGIVGLKGDSSRGSRYNSALTYQEFVNDSIPTLIIVVSEDGMVDVIPKLKPQIKHSEIIQMIGLLEHICSPENFDRRAFYTAMDWFSNRNFYLSQSECEKINDFKNKLHQLDKDLSEQTMWIMHDDLSPNPEMNDSYYFPEP